MPTLPHDISRLRSGTYLALMLSVILSAALLTGCGSEEKTSPKKQRAIPVIVADVVQESTPLIITAVGNVQPQATVAIKTQVGGTIVEQKVRDGQSVKEGELLFRLDPRPFELTIREAQARLNRNKIMLDKANKDLKRYAQLNEINAVAQDQYDKTYADTKSLESDIQLNKATLERAQLDLTYTVIKAPISGNVGMVQINEGNVIKANDDRTLCVINQLEPITVSFALPEKYLSEVMEIQRSGAVPIRILPSANPALENKANGATDASSIVQSPLVGNLTAMDNSVDTTTGTIRLRAQYPNKDHRLWPGQFVRVGLVLREKTDAILIPTAAVMDGIHGSYVYVITENNIAEDRKITVDFLSGDRTVVAKGLAAGERVALDGQVSLAPGISVEIKNKKQTAATAQPLAPAGDAKPAKSE